MKFTLIRSDLPDTAEVEHATWRITPTCGAGGGCDVRLRSVSGEYDAQVAFVNGRYRFARRFEKDFACGSGGEVDYYITGVREYVFKVVKMKLLDGEWTATRFEGIDVEKGTRGCGSSAPPEKRYAFVAVRRFP